MKADSYEVTQQDRTRSPGKISRSPRLGPPLLPSKVAIN